ncbi:unnamed protein product [Sphacelaria rigidula]
MEGPSKTDELKRSQRPTLVATSNSREEERWGHLASCCVCGVVAPNEHAIFCRSCPRTVCLSCVRSSAGDGMKLVQNSLNKGCFDLEMRECPLCLRASDKSLPAPPTVAMPTEDLLRHLLQALLQHDLSREFREPVDVTVHPDYLYKIGRGKTMDLQTMMAKLAGGKYSTRRGRRTFKEDLRRIWRNCRYYAECDEQGVPLDGTSTPAIVRCALVLERMISRFYALYMPDDDDVLLPVTSWDGWRQAKQLEDQRARLQLSEHQTRAIEANGGGETPDEVVCTTPRLPSTWSRMVNSGSGTTSNSGKNEGAMTCTGEHDNAFGDAPGPVQSRIGLGGNTLKRWSDNDTSANALATSECTSASREEIPEWALWYQLCEVSVEFNEIGTFELATRPPGLRGQDTGCGPPVG